MTQHADESPARLRPPTPVPPAPLPPPSAAAQVSPPAATPAATSKPVLPSAAPAAPAIASVAAPVLRPGPGMAEIDLPWSSDHAQLAAARRSARYPARPLRGRALVAQALVTINIATIALMMWATWRHRNAFADFRDGVSVSPARADSIDSASTLALVAYAVTFLIAAIAFVVWFYRAYSNLRCWRPTERGTKWVVLAWIIPGLNLVLPYTMIREIAVGSSDAGATTLRLRIWWVLWALFGLAGSVLGSIEPTTFAGEVRLDTARLVADAGFLVAGAYSLSVIQSLTTAQMARIRSA